MDSTNSGQTINNEYLIALTSIAKNIIEESKKIVSLYKQQHITIEPGDIVRIYCRWLGYVIRQKIVGDKEHLSKLTTDTMQANIVHGSQLCKIVQSSTKENNPELDALISSSGLIVIPVLKLTQFISNTVTENLNNKLNSLTKDKKEKAEAELDPAIYEIFENMYIVLVDAIKNLQIENPLIFLLEHFSIIVGWLMGFFSELSIKLTNHSANEGVINPPIEIS